MFAQSAIETIGAVALNLKEPWQKTLVVQVALKMQLANDWCTNHCGKKTSQAEWEVWVDLIALAKASFLKAALAIDW